MLREAGIEVDHWCAGASRPSVIMAGFFLKTEQGRPFVTLKLANSFDGRIATSTGHSQWITGPTARREVHAMRARHDAVMVGAGTARADDPSLDGSRSGDRSVSPYALSSRAIWIYRLMGQLARTASQKRRSGSAMARHPDAERARTWEGLGARLLPLCVARPSG